jgi:colanic acid biosynthesis glycosyl transferase WcaI
VKRLLIVGLNYAPELTGIGKYTGEMAEWLVAKGYEVRVVTTPPYYPQWRITEGYKAWKYTYEKNDGVSVYRCPLWLPRELRAWQRIIHLFSFVLSSAPVILWQAWRWKPDTVFVVQPSFFCTPIAWTASRIAKAKLWMHVQDFELNAAFELGMLRSRGLKKWAESIERFWMTRLDRASTISEQMLNQLLIKGVRPDACVLFPNWVDTKQIYPTSHPSIFRKRLSLHPQDVIALYSGNMGRKQGLEYLIQAAGPLQQNRHLKIVLAGDGSMRKKLEEMSKGLSNVLFLPLQPADQLNELLNLADIHLLLQKPHTSRFVMPSKLTGMLASGRPIIVTAHPGSELALSVENCGLHVTPEDSSAMIAVLIQLADDPKLREQLGEAGRTKALSMCDKNEILNAFEWNLSGRAGVPRARPTENVLIHP